MHSPSSSSDSKGSEKIHKPSIAPAEDAMGKPATEVALRGQIITPVQHKVGEKACSCTDSPQEPEFTLESQLWIILQAVKLLSVAMNLLSLAAFCLAFVFKLVSVSCHSPANACTTVL